MISALEEAAALHNLYKKFKKDQASIFETGEILRLLRWEGEIPKDDDNEGPNPYCHTAGYFPEDKKVSDKLHEAFDCMESVYAFSDRLWIRYHSNYVNKYGRTLLLSGKLDDVLWFFAEFQIPLKNYKEMEAFQIVDKPVYMKL